MSRIYVTRPSLPPLEELIPSLEKIWESRFLTNGGQFHQAFESALADYLGVEYVSLFSNATIALMAALKVCDLDGEVITTPYSFVATSNAILWNSLTPVFADISAKTFNLDPGKVEGLINEKTTAILPVHCYGIPCDVEKFDRLAEKYKLKIIYDAAHAFGVNDAAGSILRHGDLSVVSFHATKVLNTFEGGAIISPTQEMKQKIDSLKNFGYVNELNIDSVGLNGKMSEFNAALGLLQLKNVDQAKAARRRIDGIYHAGLADVAGISMLPDFAHVEPNYSYFPILINERSPIARDELHKKLWEQGILARRYFYPLIPEFSIYKKLGLGSAGATPVAEKIAQQILCLPIYTDLAEEDAHRICDAVKGIINQPA